MTYLDNARDSLGAADVYADMLRDERENPQGHSETMRRINADIGRAFKRAEILTLMDIAETLRDLRRYAGVMS